MKQVQLGDLTGTWQRLSVWENPGGKAHYVVSAQPAEHIAAVVLTGCGRTVRALDTSEYADNEFARSHRLLCARCLKVTEGKDQP